MISLKEYIILKESARETYKITCTLNQLIDAYIECSNKNKAQAKRDFIYNLETNSDGGAKDKEEFVNSCGSKSMSVDVFKDYNVSKERTRIDISCNPYETMSLVFYVKGPNREAEAAEGMLSWAKKNNNKSL